MGVAAIHPTSFKQSPQAAIDRLREELQRDAKTPPGGRLYHQIFDSGHHDHWRNALKTSGVAVLPGWVGTGTYAGLYTVDNRFGAMRRDYGYSGAPVRFELKPLFSFLPAYTKLLTEVASCVDDAYGKWRLLQPDPSAWPEQIDLKQVERYRRFFIELRIAGAVSLNHLNDVSAGGQYVIYSPDAIAAVTFPVDAASEAFEAARVQSQKRRGQIYQEQVAAGVNSYLAIDRSAELAFSEQHAELDRVYDRSPRFVAH